MSDWWFRVSKVRVRHVLQRPHLCTSIIIKKDRFHHLRSPPPALLITALLKVTTDAQATAFELSCL